MNNDKELRHLLVEEIRISKPAADGTRTLSGYAIVFNSLSQPIGTFREIISPAAVRDTLSSGKNIFLLNNHNHSQILGSTKGGNLKLATDSKGVAFTCPIDTRQSYASDLAVSVERGDTAGCSFGFTVTKDSWKNVDGAAVRTVEALDLDEITVTPYPCYLDTQIDVRSCPKELRSLLKRSIGDDEDDDECDCDCSECLVGDCEDCSNPDCDCPECEHGENSARSIDLWKLNMQLAIAKRR